MNATELRRRFDEMMARVTDEQLVAEFEAMGYQAKVPCALEFIPKASMYAHVKKHVPNLASSWEKFTHEAWQRLEPQECFVVAATETRSVLRISSNPSSVQRAAESNELALAA